MIIWGGVTAALQLKGNTMKECNCRRIVLNKIEQAIYDYDHMVKLIKKDEKDSIEYINDTFKDVYVKADATCEAEEYAKEAIKQAKESRESLISQIIDRYFNSISNYGCSDDKCTFMNYHTDYPIEE